MNNVENQGNFIYAFPEIAAETKELPKKTFKNFLFFLLFLFATLSSTKAQSLDKEIVNKEITISRITNSPSIDGVLDDAAWQNASVARDFVERKPNNGKPAPDSLATEVKIIYDDMGIYFGAVLHDPEPEKIMKELTGRDQVGGFDFLSILINGYNDHQQSLQFLVTAAGVQYDAKITNSKEDPSWNAVWYSEVKINGSNWTAEIFIPYSELRFPEKEIQEWGLNIVREFRRTGTRYNWSPVDNTKGAYSLYDGQINGLKNIQSPLRLSFQPYVSSYVNNYDGQTEINTNGGMDLKYGINDAFTLDMILVPDFGQTKFDDAVLNLSAFEVQYDDQRPFFTEGTELFTIGDLFYSRRVGGGPSGKVTLNENEQIEESPSSVDLLNALKVSGRTDDGLGIGFFNAVTEKTFATIKNTNSGDTREEVVEPLTNYNVMVLDQRFRGNSSVSLVNTNATRAGNFRDANATGLYMNLTNKKNTLNYTLSTEGSWVMEERTRFGMEGRAGIEKLNGKHRAKAVVKFRTKDYDINDLGYSSFTNNIRYIGYYGFRYLQPKGYLNDLLLNFTFMHERRLDPDLYGQVYFNFNSSFTTRDLFKFGGGFEATPFGINDFYEPRTENRHVKVPAYHDQWLWFGTDYRKKLNVYTLVDWYKYNEEGRGRLIFEFKPAYRATDNFKLRYNFKAEFSDKEEGFVKSSGNEIVFGKRNRNTLVNSMEGDYIFNNKMAVNLALRHYYSEVEYNGLYELEPSGDLSFYSPDNGKYDTTYNSWNFDLRFSWWFAPGSQLSLLYRNAIQSHLEESNRSFTQNYNDLVSQQQLNNVSLRITYYLNFNRMKNWITSSPSRKQENRDPKTGIGI
ncbi:MAG: DUF5916 domain-containing protein [Bacteroidota bacterium]